MKTKERKKSDGEGSSAVVRSTSGSRSKTDTASKPRSRFGNQAIKRYFETGGYERNQSDETGDRYETEAERVSNEAIRGSELNGTVSVINKPVARRVHEQPPYLPNEGERGIRSASGNGRPLSKQVRSYFEPRFGDDLGDVRIHTGPRSAELTDAFNARAFTCGRDIHFALNQYQPETKQGMRLLAHELTHVIQQRGTPGSGTLLQRNEKESDTGPTMGFTIWETHEFSELSDAFDTHWNIVKVNVERLFGDYSDLAKEGAVTGVNEIFGPYEENLIWEGVEASAVTSAIGTVPEVGSFISGAFGTIIDTALAREEIRLRKLKSDISEEIKEKTNQLLLYEESERREELLRTYKARVAQEYKRLVNRGEITYDGIEMASALVKYSNELFTIGPGVKEEYKNWVIKNYKPVVDEAFREPETESNYLGYGAYRSESGIIYQGPGPKL